MGAPGPTPDHGTVERYRLRRAPCRCQDCRDAWAEQMRRYRSTRRWVRHAAAGRYVQLALPDAGTLDP